MRPLPKCSVFFLLNLLTIEGQTCQLLARQTAHEEVAPPRGKTIPGIDQQPRGSNRRHPEMHRRFHPVTVDSFVDSRAAAVVHSVPNYGPSVVQARMYQIEFIAAQRTVLINPDVARFWMDRQPLRIPMPIAPDLWLYSSLVNKGVVRRNTPVIVDADDRAVVVGKVLRRMSLQVSTRWYLAIADGDKQVTVPVECQTTTVVSPSPRVCLKDLFDLDEVVIFEPTSYDGRRRPFRCQPWGFE